MCIKKRRECEHYDRNDADNGKVLNGLLASKNFLLCAGTGRKDNNRKAARTVSKLLLKKRLPLGIQELSCRDHDKVVNRPDQAAPAGE